MGRGVLLAFAICVVPPGLVIEDSCDVIEVNSFFAEIGLVFDQVIFWDWNAKHGIYVIIDWRILEGVRNDPTKEEKKETPGWSEGKWKGGHANPERFGDKYISLWHDKKHNCWRRVQAPMIRRTRTHYDVELADRLITKQEDRRGLTPRWKSKEKARSTSGVTAPSVRVFPGI